MDTGAVCITCNVSDVELDPDTEMCEDCMAEEKKADAGMDTDDDNG